MTAARNRNVDLASERHMRTTALRAATPPTDDDVYIEPPCYCRTGRHTALMCGIRRFRATGFGINPRQAALQHHPTTECRCHWCAGTTIVTTEPTRWPT